MVRADLNVPIQHGRVLDDSRIVASLNTVRTIIQQGGKVVLLSHLGRPSPGSFAAEYSLRPVAERLAQLLARPVTFIQDCMHSEAVAHVDALPYGGVMLLENLRFWPGECNNDPQWAQKLSEWGDVYVQEAFGMLHRAHASMTHLALQYTDRLVGLLVQKEMQAADRLLHKARPPYTVLVGGKKVADKLPPLRRLLLHINTLLVAGGAATCFQHAASLQDAAHQSAVKELLETARHHNVEVVLPQDVVAACPLPPTSPPKLFDAHLVPAKWQALDIGVKTRGYFSSILRNSQTLLWCGPVGVFEHEDFQEGTISMIKAFGHATERGAFTAVGGGESAAAFTMFRSNEQVSYISTGGSALLAYLAGSSLPGLEALQATTKQGVSIQV